MKWVYVDCETAKWSDEVEGGFENISDFGLSVAGIHVIEDGIGVDGWYCEMDLPFSDSINPPNRIDRDTFQKHLDQADICVSFNGERFDFEVLESAGIDCYHAEKVSYDILAQFTAVAGHRISLNDLAGDLFMDSKSADGRTAVAWWQAMRILVDAVRVHRNYGRGALSHVAIESMEISSRYLFQSLVDHNLHDVHLVRDLFYTIIRNQGTIQYQHKYNHKVVEVTLALPKALGPTFDWWAMTEF